MRRALLKRLPALMRDYHLMPWDIERLTAGELKEILADQNARAKAYTDAQRKNRRR